jgi:hypothetical protein
MSSPDPAVPILVLCRDLMFASKIRGAAAAAGDGVKIQLLRDPAQLEGLDGAALIVDLGQDGALDAGAQWKSAHPTVRAIGFVSHVDTATIAAAKAAGFDDVLTRGQFDATVTTLLPALMR